MSGDTIQALASLCGGEELDFGRGYAGVVPTQPCAVSFPHGVVATHGVAFPQRVLVGQLALLQGLDQDGRLLVQFSGAAAGSRYLQMKTWRVKCVRFLCSLLKCDLNINYFV